MKYAFATVALVAGVYAQSITDIPACALPAIDAARTSSSNCAADNYKCICDNIDALTGVATEAVLKACGATVATSAFSPWS